MSEYFLTFLVILGFGDIFSNVQTLRDADSEQGKTDAAALHETCARGASYDLSAHTFEMRCEYFVRNALD